MHREKRDIFPRINIEFLTYHSFTVTSRIPSPMSDNWKGITLPDRNELVDKSRRIGSRDRSAYANKSFVVNKNSNNNHVEHDEISKR